MEMFTESKIPVLAVTINSNQITFEVIPFRFYSYSGQIKNDVYPIEAIPGDQFELIPIRAHYNSRSFRFELISVGGGG